VDRFGESEGAAADVRTVVDTIYRSDSRRVLATLIRLLGDFDRAEEALHDAFSAAIEQWPRDGVPSNPRAWLVSAGRFRGIDTLRRRARFDASLAVLATELEGQSTAPVEWTGEDTVEDDRLRLVFTCCHPALPPDAQVALTLREVCGLTTEEIAHAFLTAPRTVAQRIVRAKGKIRDARIPYQVPARAELPDRLEAVLRVVYLVYNEGYSASSGDSLTRHDLSGREARTSPSGEVVLLEVQDRGRWDQPLIAEGIALVERALVARPLGQYAIQAAIAAVHAEARTAEATDWSQIVGLYDILLRADPSPIIELNRAVAVAMRDGPATGLDLVDGLLARGELWGYQFAHSARADLCRRLGRVDDARVSYGRALALARQEPDRRFLERRLRELS
jgi:RNA polymerase sigma-70 factor (ECF subfamily)